MQGARGEATKATEVHKEVALNLIKALVSVGGTPSGVVTTKFRSFELDPIQVPCIFGPNGLRSASKHGLVFPRCHPTLETLKGSNSP